VRKLIVDPRTSSNLATTVLYAATGGGVFRSPDGGTTWALVQGGDVWSLVALMPPAGTAHFYAGIWQQGLFHTTDPTIAWANLNNAGIGLPAHTAGTAAEPNGNFDAIFVDFCPLSPARVYAWHMKRSCDAAGNCTQTTAGIYTTASATTAWTQVATVSPPAPAYGYYAWSFGVAPNSAGNGTTDVLIAGDFGLHRSVDGGQSWQNDGTSFHSDQHSLAFSPANPPAGVIPATYIGNDGGIAKSSLFADRATAITAAPADYNEGFSTPNTFAWQNRDHGKQSSAVFQYTSDPGIAAFSYIGCQDTGVAAGAGSLGWRGIADADGGAIAASAATSGVAVWGILGDYGGWAPFRMLLWTDKGEFQPSAVFATMPGGSALAASRGTASSLSVGRDGKCLAGVLVHDSDTTLSAAVVANAAAQSVTPASMTNIIMFSSLIIDSGANQERVIVTATTATTFSAVFLKSHPVGAAIQNDRHIVARVDDAGAAVQISQDFVGTAGVRVVSVHPSDANILYCWTSDQRVWRTLAAAAAGPGTVWSEVATGKPPGTSVASIAIAPNGNAYVLLLSSVNAGGVTTPLFEVSSGTWVAQSSTGLPTGFNFGKIVADPVQPGVLYCTYGARAYQMTLGGGTWTWTNISDGLPGQWLYDLWVGRIGAGANTKVLLRAAIPTRAVFERDVTAAAVEPQVSLYLRDNLLDQGWLNPSLEGMVNPYNPPNERVWHYQCADIKIDAQQRHGTVGAPDFFQTDPEGTPIPPLHHVLFDELVDSSANLPQTDAALVHVQVWNRSLTAANAVSVWAIFSRVSAGVPALSKSASSGDAYPFWNQFQANGTITPSLPADSPWTAVGPPLVLNGIDASHPQIASWNWTIPALPTGDPGHYCMVALVHSVASPVGETTRMNVDPITMTNRQVGQKNLHIGAALPPGPGPSGSPAFIEAYIEFHNPTTEARRGDFVIDARALPAPLELSFHLTETATGAVRPTNVVGIASARNERVSGKWIRAAARPGITNSLIALLARLLRSIRETIRRLLGRPPRPWRVRKGDRLPLFVPTRFVASPSALVRVRNAVLEPLGYAAALIRIRPTGPLSPGRQYRLEVQQWLEGRAEGAAVLGGATIVVNVAGEPERPKPMTPPSHDEKSDKATRERLERESEEKQPVLPWAEEIMKRRRDEQHRD
jgi:hypothetical protein